MVGNAFKGQILALCLEVFSALQKWTSALLWVPCWGCQTPLKIIKPRSQAQAQFSLGHLLLHRQDKCYAVSRELSRADQAVHMYDSKAGGSYSVNVQTINICETYLEFWYQTQVMEVPLQQSRSYGLLCVFDSRNWNNSRKLPFSFFFIFQLAINTTNGSINGEAIIDVPSHRWYFTDEYCADTKIPPKCWQAAILLKSPRVSLWHLWE